MVCGTPPARKKIRQFLTFIGREPNCQFDSRPTFGHNLCLKCPNGSCDPILNNYVPRSFQWYKELFNPISIDPYNCSLKIWESIGSPTPKMGAHLGVWGFVPSHYLTFPGFPFGPHPYKPLPWSPSPRLRLRQMKLSLQHRSGGFQHPIITL